MRPVGFGALIFVLIAACGGQESLVWTYEQATPYADRTWAVDALAAGDFDGEGHADLVVADPTDGRIFLLEGLGRGRFASPPAVPILGEPGRRLLRSGSFDGDDVLDLLVVDPVSGRADVYLGCCDGGFSATAPGAPLPGTERGLHQILAATMDDDDLTDLVLLDETGGVHVLSCNGDATFTRVADEVLVGDAIDRLILVAGVFDDMPGTDVAVLDASRGALTILSGSPGGALTPGPSVEAPLPSDLRAAAPCAGRAPGRTEIVLLYGSDGARRVRKLFTQGTRAGRLSVPPVAVGAATDLVSCDVTGDGLCDVLLVDPEANEIRILLATGS